MNYARATEEDGGMGRKRFISSDISTDEKLAEVAEENPAAALMWPWLCTALDDWGRMSANPREVKLNVFPGFMFSAPDIQKAMELLDRVGLCHLYQIDGHQYLQVNPETFYDLNTYIQKSRQQTDGSKAPPPPDHPWGRYWRNLQPAATDADNGQPVPDEAATFADRQQEAATGAPSLSPSPSPSETPVVTAAATDRPDGWADLMDYVKRNRMRWYNTPAVLHKMLEAAGEMTAPVVQLAVEQAVARDAQGYSYVDSILGAWRAAGVTTVDQARAEIDAFQATRREAANHGHRPAATRRTPRPGGVNESPRSRWEAE